MMHKALIGFDINEYPEIEIFQKYFECDFCEYNEDYFIKNISKYTIFGASSISKIFLQN